MGIIPSIDGPMSIQDPSLISFLRGKNYTDNAMVGIRLRANNDVSQSKITFGGYEPSILFPNSSSEISWQPRVIVENMGAVPDVDIFFGNISLQNKSFVHVDSFFPGIVLPHEAWKVFEDFILKMKS